ncbi:MAG: hypothetical protein CLLPBCKN_000653 [Chroococcidiopsis cubana SAG 39.79]|nr:hypothetical protein [Chroococcidiopsis cubana SAG 39.79]
MNDLGLLYNFELLIGVDFLVKSRDKFEEYYYIRPIKVLRSLCGIGAKI